MRKIVLPIVAILAGIIVIAAASAQFALESSQVCEVAEPFTCHEYEIDGNNIIVTISAETELEDVRISLTTNDCELTQDHQYYTSADRFEALFACEDMPAALTGELHIIYGEPRQVSSGQLAIN